MKSFLTYLNQRAMMPRFAKLNLIYTVAFFLSFFFFIKDKLYRPLDLQFNNQNLTRISSELFNAQFEYLNVKNQASHIILISVKKSDITHEISSKKKFKAVLTRAKLKRLFEVLASSDAFVLDVDALKNIPDRVKKLEDVYGLMKNASNPQNEQILINFGVSISSFEKLYKNIGLSLDSQLCNFLFKSNSVMFSGESILTNMFIECTLLTIQVSIVYQRGNFLWILNDDYTRQNHRNSPFGNVPRAFNRFEITRIEDVDSNTFYIPSDIKKYFFDYEHSEFIECNKKLQFINSNPGYLQNDKMNKMISPSMEYISRSLEGAFKRYWLSGGTLLGWYRDCGIIPHTKDVDFGILAEDYEASVNRIFIGNQQVRLWSSLGLVCYFF